MGQVATHVESGAYPDEQLFQVIDRLCADLSPDRVYMDCDDLGLALLQEISETVLPRQVFLTGPDGEIGNIILGHRGVIGFEFVAGKLADAAFDPENPGAVARQFLKEFRLRCAGNGPFRILFDGPVSYGARKSTLFSAQALSGLLASPQVTQKTDTFFARLQDICLGWMVFPAYGRHQDHAQNPDDAGILPLWASHLPPLAPPNVFAQARGTAAPSCSIFPCRDALFVLVLTDHAGRRLMLLDKKGREEAMRLWQQAFDPTDDA